MNPQTAKCAPLSDADKALLLAKFNQEILNSHRNRRAWSVRLKGVHYFATLTNFGRIIVRDVYGNEVASMGFGAV